MILKPKSRFRAKAREWIQRYGPAELAAACTAIIGYFLTFGLTGGEIAAAFGGAIGDNLGYYGTILTRDFKKDRRQALESGESYGAQGRLRTIKRLFLEFGFSEILDLGIVRPFTMGLGARYMGRGLGVLLGKIVADVIFYIPTIASYEFGQHLNEKEDANICSLEGPS